MDTENKDQNFSNNDLKKVLKLSLQKNEEILAISQEIKQYIKWQKIWSVFRLLLIFVPIILGFIYLPPIFRDFFKDYGSFFN